jgi:MFS family permease
MEKEKFSLLWFAAVLFFAYQFVLRLSPGVLIDELMIKYQISASTFGLITSVYYAGYAGMQIPMGIIVDRYGIRCTVAISALICVFGNIFLIMSDHWFIALLGRCLVGIGSAAGALGAISAARLCFSHKHLSKMIGFSVMLSLLGAIYGKSINHYFVDTFGMEKSIFYLTLPGIIIALGILIFLLEKKMINQVYGKAIQYGLL